MLVLKTHIAKRRHGADFGRVEARVVLLVKTRTGQPPHWISVLTQQPASDKATLDARLTRDAIRLARHLPLYRHKAARPATRLAA